MEYLIRHPHEPIMSSNKNIFKTNQSSIKCSLELGNAKIKQTQGHSIFAHILFDEDDSKDIYGRKYFTSKYHLFNGTIIYWCSKKQSDNSRRTSYEKKTMYTGVLYQNWIGNFCRTIGYPIVSLSKL